MPPKFNFIAEETLKKTSKWAKEKAFICSISSNKQIYFPRHVYAPLQWDKKHIKFYVDTDKHCIAWHVFAGGEGITTMRGARLGSVSAAGSLRFSVGKIIVACIGTGDIKDYLPAKKLKIRKYKGGMLDENLYYIQLRKHHDQGSDTVGEEDKAGN